jgi:phospholipid/cholesterol/gamma-HCH transport system substrate-binding protein
MGNVLNEKDARFKGLNVKVGVFITLALVIAAVLLVGLAVRQGLFEAKTQVVFVAASGEGLHPGMAVKLSGFKIGEVSSVALNEGAEVDVDMLIENRYMKWIRADSVAVLSREGLIGDSYIAMTAGGRTQPALSGAGVVGFRAGAGLADIAEDVRNRVVPVIGELTTLLHNANDPKGDLRQSLKESRELLVEVRQTRKKLDTVLGTMDEMQKGELRDTLGKMRTTLSHVDNTLQVIDHQVPALTDRVGGSLDKVDQSLKKVDAATAAAHSAADKASAAIADAQPRMNSLLDDSRTLVNNSNQAVGAMRQHWPFRGDAQPAAISGKR